MEVILSIDDNNFYKKIKKVKDKEIIIILKQNDKIIDLDISDYFDDIDSKWKIHSVIASNIKNIEKRYNYIYDTVCDYLDKEFQEKNICQFRNNKCIGVTDGYHCKESINGCCFGRKRGLCKHFNNGKCNIKSISCKLFTCRYLKKNKIKYNSENIPLLKYFFNKRQKTIIEDSIFIDKEEIINMLLNKQKNRKYEYVYKRK